MLQLFGFDRVGVAVGDLHFLDPNPGLGQEGAEQGVRLEVRLVELGDPPGGIYSSRPISVGRPIWRADLLESVANPGSLDRAHHHPNFQDWEPGRRSFSVEMTRDPLAFTEARLADLHTLVAEAGVDPSEVGPDDANQIRSAVPRIMDAVRTLLEAARRGSSVAAAEASPAGVREGWL